MWFEKNGSIKEGIEIFKKEYQLTSVDRLTESGEIFRISTLTFNPNKVLDGHNLYNSREGRTMDALEKIKLDLEKDGIGLDYSSAIVITAEINSNFKIDFLKLEPTLDLMFSILSDFKSKKIYGNSREKHIRNHRVEESHWWSQKGNEHRSYDKNKELKEKQNLEYKTPITRLEWEPTEHRFTKAFSDNGLDVKLMTVLENLEIIDNMFKKYWFNVMKKTFSFLEKVYSKKLELAYLSFKDIQNTARKSGKKVPRGIYKWLEENYIVYDTKYLLDIVKKYNSKNYSREKVLIEKKFKDKCLDKIEFLTVFFSSLNSNNED